MFDNIGNIGIISSADGSTQIYVSENDNLGEKTSTTVEINNKLDSMTMEENLNAGLKIMGVGMAAVFVVLTILYLVIKIMGHFATSKEDKNEKN